MMVVGLSCQVAIVLSGPRRGANIFSRNHDSCRSGRNITDSTWYIVVEDESIWTSKEFILSTMDHTRSPQYSCCVICVVRVFGKAHFFHCSSLTVKISSPSSSRINKLSSSGTWTRALPPPGVGHSCEPLKY